MADDIDREAKKPGPMRDKLREIGANFRTVANNTQFLAVDFDAIADQRCRKTFHSIGTSWALPGNQLDGLNVMGEALLAQNPDFPKVLHGGQCTTRPALGDGRTGLCRPPARRVMADRAARAISP